MVGRVICVVCRVKSETFRILYFFRSVRRVLRWIKVCLFL